MNHLNCRRPSIGIFEIIKKRLAAGLAASSELGIFFYLNKLTNKDRKCQRKVVFRSAYALSDPTPELLNLIKAHPTELAIRDLLVYYFEAVEGNPSRAYALTSVLVALRDSPDAPVIEGSSTLTLAFYGRLHDLIPRGFDFDKDNKTFGPTNTYLVNCLLSGLSFKYNLTSSTDQYGEIRKGLNTHSSSSTDSELLVIGACIQLLTNGSGIVPTGQPFIHSANEVATKLRSQQSAGRVKEPNALKLLEVCRLFYAT
jgi:hypothetical protein